MITVCYKHNVRFAFRIDTKRCDELGTGAAPQQQQRVSGLARDGAVQQRVAAREAVQLRVAARGGTADARARALGPFFRTTGKKVQASRSRFGLGRLF